MSDQPPPSPVPDPQPSAQGSADPAADSARSPETEPGASGASRVSTKAAQAGAAAARLSVERDAIAGLGASAAAEVRGETFVGRDINGEVVVGRDYIVVNHGAGDGASPLRACPLSSRDLDEVLSAFVGAPNHADLRRELADRRFAVLRGPAGCGKSAAATKLLLESGHAELYFLHQDTDLAGMRETDIESGAGYIVEGPPTREPLSRFAVQNIERSFGLRDSRLIIVLPDETVIADHAVETHVLTVRGAPDAMQVFSTHVRWRCGPGRADRARRILADEAVTAFVGQWLGDHAPVRDAATLARLIAQAEGTPAEAVALVREQLAARDAAVLDDWFSQDLKDIGTQCLAVAVAAFGGEPYETAAALSRSLLRRMRPPESPDHPGFDHAAPLTGSRTGRLAKLHAGIEPSQVTTRHGTAPGDVVRFREPGFANRVLLHVWTEYDEFRTALPGWLLDCAKHDLESVRTRAAVAVGFLAQRSFDMVRATILNRWAASDDEHLRAAAATALHAIVKDPRLAAPVQDLIQSWAADDPVRSHRPAAVARAWHTVLDGKGSMAAASLLNRLAETEENDLQDAIMESVAEYLALDDDRHRRNVLKLLLRWTGPWEPRRRPIGIASFLLSAGGLLDPAADGSDVRWPTLLAVASRDAALRADIAALWYVSISDGEFSPLAYEFLAGWAATAEADPAVRAALTELLSAVTGHDARTSERAGRLIRYQAKRWAQGADGHHAPKTAAAVLSRLDQYRVERNGTP